MEHKNNDEDFNIISYVKILQYKLKDIHKIIVVIAFFALVSVSSAVILQNKIDNSFFTDNPLPPVISTKNTNSANEVLGYEALQGAVIQSERQSEGGTTITNNIPPNRNTQNTNVLIANVSAGQAKSIIETDKKETDIKSRRIVDRQFFILDVRTVKEYDSGHLRDSKLIPIESIDKRLDEIPRDKKILVYSETGKESINAINILIQNGFTEVYNLDGGIAAWKNAGYETDDIIHNFP